MSNYLNLSILEDFANCTEIVPLKHGIKDIVYCPCIVDVMGHVYVHA